MRILRGLLEELNTDEAKAMERAPKDIILDCQILFALVWGVGGSLTGANRKKFDLFLKRLLGGDI